jgi:hypothetical protein
MFFQKKHLMIMQRILNQSTKIFVARARFCDWICAAGCNDDDGHLQTSFTDKI